MDFLDSFSKQIEKMDGVATSSEPPRYWFSFGNYTLNSIMSGEFDKGLPQGRLTGIVGPSGAGKSFLAGNLAKSAQDQGAFVLILDSEGALDDSYLQKIGFDTEKNYMYVDVKTISSAQGVISAFLKNYKQEYGEISPPDAPKVMIILDSLDMLLTDTELENYDKQIQKGDQGQRSKQLKAMLRTFVQDIKRLNVSMAVTGQVYANQDLKNGEGLWVVNQAIRFSLSQIVLLTKLKLKDKAAGTVQGIRMKCQGFKTRFTKPFQEVTVEVPYDKGMDPHSGLLEAALSQQLVIKKGSRYSIAGEDSSWYAKDIAEHSDKILALLSDRGCELFVADNLKLEEDDKQISDD